MCEYYSKPHPHLTISPFTPYTTTYNTHHHVPLHTTQTAHTTTRTNAPVEGLATHFTAVGLVSGMSAHVVLVLAHQLVWLATNLTEDVGTHLAARSEVMRHVVDALPVLGDGGCLVERCLFVLFVVTLHLLLDVFVSPSRLHVARLSARDRRGGGKCGSGIEGGFHGTARNVAYHIERKLLVEVIYTIITIYIIVIIDYIIIGARVLFGGDVAEVGDGVGEKAVMVVGRLGHVAVDDLRIHGV